MSTFSAYEKMPSSMKKTNLSTTELAKAEKTRWVVTEKVHGANFSFVYDKGTLRYAKRRGYLAWSDNFFGYQCVVSAIEGRMQNLFEDLSATVPGTRFTIYGELFGGHYPHPKIAPIEGVNAIQTGVYYTPEIKFYAFDISVEAEDGLKKYIAYDTAITYFEKFDIFYAKPLFVGKLSKALDFNPRMNSTIPRQFQLPELKSNLMEGVVIKPYTHIAIFDKNASRGRPILKVKNAEFDEEDKFHQAKKWYYNVPEGVASLSEDTATVVSDMKRRFVTRNRLQSAISKIGPLDFGDTQRVEEIKREFVSDIVEDYPAEDIRHFTQDQLLWVKERIAADVGKLMLELNRSQAIRTSSHKNNR